MAILSRTSLYKSVVIRVGHDISEFLLSLTVFKDIYLHAEVIINYRNKMSFVSKLKKKKKKKIDAFEQKNAYVTILLIIND